MKTATGLVWVLMCCSSSTCSLVPVDGLVQNVAREQEESILTPLKPYRVIHECVETIADEGVFYIKSRGTEETCGLYLFSAPDTTIEMDLEYSNAPCQTGALVAMVDGWEMQGQVFPSASEHARPLEDRFLEFCDGGGQAALPGHLPSSQNAAMLQYKLPSSSSSVTVRVRHLRNHAPCNQLTDGSGVYTLRSSIGRPQNCTLISIGWVHAQLLQFRVGVSPVSRWHHFRPPASIQCDTLGWTDYVEVGESAGLDSSHAVAKGRLCGLGLHPGADHTTCSSMLVVRLVSSGRYQNVVQVRTRLPSSQELLSCMSELPVDLQQALADYDL